MSVDTSSSVSRTETQQSAATQFALPRDVLWLVALMLSAFVGLGILYGGGGVLWNDVIDAFGISEGAFGIASGVGLIFSFPVLIFGGRLADRFDKRLLLAVSLAAAIVPAAAMIFGSGFAFLTLILILQGCGLVMLDLSNNALGMDFERYTRRHIMGPLHAAFSGGALLGPLIVAIIIRADGGYRATYAVIAMIFGGLAIFAFWTLRLKPLAAPIPIHNQSPLHSLHLLRSPITRNLALITFIAFGAEMLIAQWVGIYFEDERDYAKSITVLALSLNGAAMLVGRLGNGPFTARLGAGRALATQGVVTLAGGLLIGLSPNAAIAAAGCGIAGLGLAGMAPTVLNLVGIANPNAPGAAAGAVLLMGYLGIAIAPFLAGFFSTYASTRVALLGIAVGGLAVALIARHLRSIALLEDARPSASAP